MAFGIFDLNATHIFFSHISNEVSIYMGLNINIWTRLIYLIAIQRLSLV